MFSLIAFSSWNLLWFPDLSMDLYNSTKRRKEYLVLTCGPPSISTSVPKGKGEDGESCSEDESSDDEAEQTVSFCLNFSHPPSL